MENSLNVTHFCFQVRALPDTPVHLTCPSVSFIARKRGKYNAVLIGYCTSHVLSERQDDTHDPWCKAWYKECKKANSRVEAETYEGEPNLEPCKVRS